MNRSERVMIQIAFEHLTEAIFSEYDTKGIIWKFKGDYKVHYKILQAMSCIEMAMMQEAIRTKKRKSKKRKVRK